MADKTLANIAETMRDIDFCMLSTRGPDGGIAARPMSNNRDVAFDGECWFFTDEKTQTVSDIGRDAQIGLGFQGKSGLFGKPPMFIAVEGRATLNRDRDLIKAKWHKSLNFWWDGPEDPGIVLIKVQAERIHWWDGMDEGEIITAGITA